jgi:thymidylate synthase (FAD)
MNTETAPKLLKYLANHQHWSPFEMASMTLEIVTTRDIARQLLRHRSFAFQEFSQRYATVNDEDETIHRECRLQHPTNRQASLEGASQENIDWFEAMQEGCQTHAMNAYREALKRGVAKEQARVFLPEGLTKSTLYMAGSIRSWIHYIQIRTHVATQKEHREIAEMCKVELLKHFPSLEGML